MRNTLEIVNWENYETKTLELISKECTRTIQETITSYREMYRSCTFLLTLFLAILTFSISQVLLNGSHMLVFAILAFGVSLSAIIIFQGIKPQNITYSGGRPDLMTHPDLEQRKGEQYRDLHINIIEGCQLAIHNNDVLIAKRVKWYNLSLKIFAIFLALTLVVWAVAPLCFLD